MILLGIGCIHPTSADQQISRTIWNGTLQLAPADLFYTAPVASPLRPMFALTVAHYEDSEIPDAGDLRYVLSLGKQFGVVRLHPPGEPDRGFQLDIGGSFVGVFDIDNSLDHLGWDGIYGILGTWSDGKKWSAKTGLQHDSSHLGDEYIEKTGQERIDYTREEWIFGLSRDRLGPWRLYAETAFQFGGGNAVLQDDWRLQTGFEFEGSKRFFDERAAPYAALNLNTFEERDWDPTFTIQAGLVMPVDNLARRYRVGLQYHNGRSMIGEFFQEDEKMISIGLWLDL